MRIIGRETDRRHIDIVFDDVGDVIFRFNPGTDVHAEDFTVGDDAFLADARCADQYHVRVRICTHHG